MKGLQEMTETKNPADAQTINGIIEARKNRAADLRKQGATIRSVLSGFMKFKSKIESTKDDLSQEQNPEPRIVKAISVCSEAISSIDAIIKNATEVEREISVTLPHFTRDLFCVAEAGGTQAGKSTVLQKIVGMDEDTDPNCPIVGGGDGKSTTAARCSVINIEKNERQHAQIRFFEPDEFMANVVTPYASALRDRGIPLPRLETLADFEAFDVQSFLRDATNVIQANTANSTEAQQWKERFFKLREKYKDYNELLGYGTIDIPLDEAVQYIVYPTAKQRFWNLPYKCVAVKEATLYCNYPNAVVSRSEYIDLPGAGEIAPDVEKRYIEGFNLSTDLVLFVGAYNGKPYTNEQAKMVDNLGKIVPGGQLDNYMIYFQNDFHEVDGLAPKLLRATDINRGAPTPVYAIDGRGANKKIYRIEPGTETPTVDVSALEVNEIGNEGRVVVFGEGNDAEYVTQTLVPVLCSFAAVRLPMLDEAIIKQVTGKCESVRQTCAQFEEKTKAAISQLIAGIPATAAQHFNEVTKRVKDLRIAFLTARRSVADGYKKRTMLVSAERARTPVGIQCELLTEIDAPGSGLLIETDDRTLLRKIEHAAGTNVAGTIEAYVRSIRLRITERFSKLEDIYDSLISDLLNHVFMIVRNANDEESGRGVPFLSSDNGSTLIQSWVDALEKACCPVLAAAAKDLAAVRVQFYQSVYPDIRKAVFHRPDYAVVQDEFQNLGNAENTLATLRELAHDWAYDTGDSISLKNAAREIVYCAVERFFDRTLFSPESETELPLFVHYWWPQLAPKETSPAVRFRERFASLLQQLNDSKRV